MTVNVFEMRGVYLFRLAGEAPPSLSRYYNADADRFEVPDRETVATIPGDWTIVEDPDAFRVRFRGNPPRSALQAALLIEDAPGQTTLLYPSSSLVEEAVDAGGERVDPED